MFLCFEAARCSLADSLLLRYGKDSTYGENGEKPGLMGLELCHRLHLGNRPYWLVPALPRFPWVHVQVVVTCLCAQHAYACQYIVL